MTAPAYTIDGVDVTEAELREHLEHVDAERAETPPDPTGAPDAERADSPSAPPAAGATDAAPGSAHNLDQIAEDVRELDAAWPAYVISWQPGRGFVAFDPGTNHTWMEDSAEALDQALSSI
jgi:hypothetical protein